MKAIKAIFFWIPALKETVVNAVVAVAFIYHASGDLLSDSIETGLLRAAEDFENCIILAIAVVMLFQVSVGASAVLKRLGAKKLSAGVNYVTVCFGMLYGMLLLYLSLPSMLFLVYYWLPIVLAVIAAVVACGALLLKVDGGQKLSAVVLSVICILLQVLLMYITDTIPKNVEYIWVALSGFSLVTFRYAFF